MIGVFDSGFGGLSVLEAIVSALPNADISYVADDNNVPYGDKSEQFIGARTLKIGQFLAAQNHEMIVIACNTATAAGAEKLRQLLPNSQIIGIEPGIKPAALASKTGKIAVLTTSVTAKSARLAALIKQYAGNVYVDVLPCPGWANVVESLRFSDTVFIKEAHQKLEKTLSEGSDQIVLGCTHYSFLRPTLEKIINGRAHIIDVSEAVARRCVSVISQQEVAQKTKKNEHGQLQFFCTKDPKRLQNALPALGLAHFLDKQKNVAQLLQI